MRYLQILYKTWRTFYGYPKILLNYFHHSLRYYIKNKDKTMSESIFDDVCTTADTHKRTWKLIYALK